MAELVVFEDSPLGEYLREVGAGETLVVEDSPDICSLNAGWGCAGAGGGHTAQRSAT
ncbi:hypothetical protein LPJ61_006577, partial [Coemansia biformis]